MAEWKLTKREPDEEAVKIGFDAALSDIAPDFDECIVQSVIGKTVWHRMHDAAPSEATEAVKALVRAVDDTNPFFRSGYVQSALDRLRALCPELFEEEGHEAE